MMQELVVCGVSSQGTDFCIELFLQKISICSYSLLNSIFGEVYFSYCIIGIGK